MVNNMLLSMAIKGQFKKPKSVSQTSIFYSPFDFQKVKDYIGQVVKCITNFVIFYVFNNRVVLKCLILSIKLVVWSILGNIRSFLNSA